MAEPIQATAANYRFLSGGGTAAQTIAALNWAATPLGDIAQWPCSLKTTVGMLLRSPVAMTLLWGPDGVMIYNDAYAAIAGDRHPAAMGAKVCEVWPDATEFNQHVLTTVLAGASLTCRDQEVSIWRNGGLERAWFTLEYSAVADDSDRPAGVLAVVVETTGKMQVQTWLASERERLRQMFEQSPGFMAMLRGPEHRFDLVNPAYMQLIGHRDVLGRPIRDALPEIAGQGYYELLDQVFASGAAFSGTAVEVDLQRTPGTLAEQRFVDFVYQPVRDPAGAVQGIFVQGADVTDHILAQRAVRSTETRNRQILDSAIDYAIMAFDMSGKVTRWNEGAYRIHGWSEAEMLGQHISCIFTPEDRATGRLELEMRMALTRGVGNDERWHIRKSGERFWANGEMTPIRDDAGHVTGLVKVLRDRTEQHRAAEALKESEARLRRAQQAGGVGTFTIDLSGNTISGTPEFYRIFGLDEEAGLPVSAIEELVVPEDRHAQSGARGQDPQATPLDVEYRIRRADDGARRWISRKAEFETDASGTAVRMVGVVQDITARKEALQALEESARQFRTFAQAQPNHVWTAPRDGRLDWFNDRVYEYSGAWPGTLDRARWSEIVHPDDVHAAVASWAAAVSTGENYETEFRIRRADGEYRWHLVRAVALKGADGLVGRWVGTNTDIHAHKLQEAESTRDRNRIWTLSQELMLVCDFEGVISAVNPAATRVLGWTEDEMVGVSLTNFLHPGDLPGTRAELGKLAEGATTLAFENRYRTKNGAYRLLNWTAVPDGGRIHAVARDVSRERTAEEALRQSQKMEALGQLTGGIAHDFNNLLQAIMSSVTALQKLVAVGRVAEIDRFINGALNSCRRAAALTHRLLAFSRRQPLEPRAAEVNPLRASMEDLLRRTLGERIRFQMVLSQDPCLTKCDPNQLENAILNLAINSRDAMPDGGSLMIETCNARLEGVLAANKDDVQPGSYVCISVTDDGTGMSAETSAKAFEPFFTTKPTGQGTGLGLSMIYGFARQSDGYAKIDSELGHGTTVKLYLPSDSGSAPSRDPALAVRQSPALAAAGTVLVVEDEPVVRALVTEELREVGYRVLEAGDGPAGLRLLQSNEEIDLLLTDVGLPGLNGRQLADAGRQLRPGLTVLFMTGYAENAVFASSTLDTGMSMVTKPFLMDTLVSKVREMIASKGAGA
jgi:PAS domain S-box-containing protein